jgi:hypothetical protein
MSNHIFADDVYSSTDLQRRAGDVFDQARSHPVTISRNNEQFALFSRELAAELFKAARITKSAFEALTAVLRALKGEQVIGAMAWLTLYEKDDLERFCAELTEGIEVAGCSSDWEGVQAIIYEWRESAMVAKSGVIDAAMFTDESSEEPLPHPLSINPTQPPPEVN